MATSINYRLFFKFLLYAFGLLPAPSVLGQTSLSGPDCVVSEQVYEYSIINHWEGSASVSICVEGGIIVPDEKACYNGQPLTRLRIRWEKVADVGKIAITGTHGSASLNVFITPKFDPGIILKGSHQVIEEGRLPEAIVASDAKGGGCHNSYTYQWQESGDNVKWKDMKGQTGPTLTFHEQVKQTTYFRRMVVSAGNTVGYTDVAAMVLPESKTKL